MADIIDINVSQTTETVTINTTPNLTTININTVTGGGSAVTSVNGDIGDVIVPVSDNNFTNALKTKLDGIATGAEVNVNADWNATSGDAQILNKPTIPTQTSQLTNNGADGTNPFITALDIPTAGQAGTLVREVKNMTGATLNKGTVVYISGANGNKPLVSKALATSDALSARTFGLLQSNISNNGLGYCVIIGDLTGLDTSAYTEGVQLYLSGVTAGTYTSTKTLAPTHLVYIGKVTRSHPTLGQIEVGIQNGYELEEIHDVAITSVADKQLLSYDLATDLWKNKSVTTADISDSTNKRYVTDANLTTIGNQSGTNTGDQDLSNLVVKNTAITGATKTKITYDSKGLVTAGADATTADIADSTNKRYQTDNQNSFNDATSSIQTQLNSKSNKSISSYSLLVNNTASTADVTETTYRSPSQQTYTGTITWTGTTAPSGATNHTYNWHRIGNLVTLKITLVYATTGAALTAVNVTLPTDCPTPLKPTGLTAASNNLYTGSGLFANSLTGTPSASNRVLLRSNAANNGFEISSNGPSAGYLFSDIIVQYFTS